MNEDAKKDVKEVKKLFEKSGILGEEILGEKELSLLRGGDGVNVSTDDDEDG